MLIKLVKDILCVIGSLINSLVYFFSGFIKKKPNRVIMGSWSGHKISDNPKYLLDHLKNYHEIEVIWCGRKHLKNKEIFNEERIKFVEYNSLKSFYYAATSKYVFISNTYRDIVILNLFRGAVITQLWHGFGLKNTLATKELSFFKKLYYKIGQNTYEKCHYFISSSNLNTNKILKTFKYHGINKNSIITHGQPKNDFLINNSSISCENLREEIRSKLSIPKGKKLVLYLPTFREDKESFSFSGLTDENADQIRKVLKKHNAIFLEKKHLKDIKKEGHNNDEYFYFLERDVETQELLLISDVLITDYSSCFLDFVLLDRPIIHFAYDLDEYKNHDRGFFYSLEELAAGPIVKDLDILRNHLAFSLDNSEYHKELRTTIRSTAMTFETGISCNKIVQRVITFNR